MGKFCINDQQLNLISGNIDGPQFKKDADEIYYNHDLFPDMSNDLDLSQNHLLNLLVDDNNVFCLKKY